MDPECDNFYLGENGVTIFCPNADIDSIGVVNGIEYTKAESNEAANVKSQWSDLSFQKCVPVTSEICRRCLLMLKTLISISALGIRARYWIWSGCLKAANSSTRISVTGMSDRSKICMMFENARVNSVLGSWDVSNVELMGGMFGGPSRLIHNLAIGMWQNVSYMAGMFWQSDFNHDIGSWDVRSVSSMANMCFWCIII